MSTIPKQTAAQPYPLPEGSGNDRHLWPPSGRDTIKIAAEQTDGRLPQMHASPPEVGQTPPAASKPSANSFCRTGFADLHSSQYRGDLLGRPRVAHEKLGRAAHADALLM
jgi:hypothetical protein